MSEKERKEIDAAVYHDGDIATTRFERSLEGFEGDDDESRGTQNYAPQISAELIHEVDDLLAKDEVYARSELDELLRKLDVAIAINNDPKARELRSHLIKKFGVK